MNQFTVVDRRSSYSHRRISVVVGGLMRSEPRPMEIENMNQDIGKVGYVLIVSSDPTMRRAVSLYFSDHNLPTSSGSNWSELKCTGTPPSLIIMDEQLG